MCYSLAQLDAWGKRCSILRRPIAEIEIAWECDLGDAIEPAMKNCDVAIDFSQADSTDEICGAALKHGKPLVIGTTGHSPATTQNH